MAGVAKPGTVLSWATNANYGAGPYVGNPNKAAPAAGVIAEGFDPTFGIPTEWLNQLHNLAGQWSGFLNLPANLTTQEHTDNVTPQLDAQNSAGATRGGFDHLGYPRGQPTLRFKENWLFPVTSTTPVPATLVPFYAGSPWSLVSQQPGAASNVTSEYAMTSNDVYKQLAVTPGNANADNVFMVLGRNVSRSGCLVHLDNVFSQFVIEYVVSFSASDNTKWIFGLTDDTETGDAFNHDTGHPKHLAIFSTNGGVWNSEIDNGAAKITGGLTDTPPAYPIFHRIRIEYHGSSSPYGAVRARYFINGVLRGADVGGLPAGVSLRPAFGGVRKAGALASICYVASVDIWSQGSQ